MGSATNDSFFPILYLRQDGTQADQGQGICVQAEGQVEVWKYGDGCRCEQVFEIQEGFTTFRSPVKPHFFLCECM